MGGRQGRSERGRCSDRSGKEGREEGEVVGGKEVGMEREVGIEADERQSGGDRGTQRGRQKEREGGAEK